MAAIRRILFSALSNSPSNYTTQLPNNKWISTTVHLNQSWMNKIKEAFTGKTSDLPTNDEVISKSLTLLEFADGMHIARWLSSFKRFLPWRSSETRFKADAIAKQEAIIRVLGGFDPTGENIQHSQKQEAAKLCYCTIADVEYSLATFIWTKKAQKKVEKLKEEGKPLPKTLAEVEILMGSSPMDIAKSSMAESRKIRRKALCPCGCGRRYKHI